MSIPGAVLSSFMATSRFPHGHWNRQRYGHFSTTPRICTQAQAHDNNMPRKNKNCQLVIVPASASASAVPHAASDVEVSNPGTAPTSRLSVLEPSVFTPARCRILLAKPHCNGNSEGAQMNTLTEVHPSPTPTGSISGSRMY
jgi:hypothetical protein